MKEMIYKTERKNAEILHEGAYKGFKFCILNLGTHPTAYVKIPKNHKYYNAYYDDCKIEVHGGLTFSGNLTTAYENDKGHWVGWDYAHCDDYAGYEERYDINLRAGGKKWTTEEIFEDVKSVINQLDDIHE